jgi:hypothetical protein
LSNISRLINGLGVKGWMKTSSIVIVMLTSKKGEKILKLIRSLGCMLAHLIGYLEFSISNSGPHHLWPRLVAGAEL